jgi:Type II secretory pathway, component PulD
MTCSLPRLALPIALPIGLLAAALCCALPGRPGPPPIRRQGNTLDVRGADIRAFIQDVARATGTSFIVDPAVQGTVDYSNPQSMSQADMLGVLLTILRSHGLVAVPAGQGTYRVVPDQGAAGQGTGSNAHFATQVIGLRRIDARIAAETLKPLLGRGGVVIATPQGNSLLIADYSDNIARIRSLVAQIDSDNASIDTLTLRNSSAREIAATLNALFGVRGEGGSQVLSILPVESSNSIVIRGDAGVVQRAINMAAELDRRAESTGDVRVVKLQHASAEQLLPVLQQLIGQGEGSSNASARAAPPPRPTAAARWTPTRRC